MVRPADVIDLLRNRNLPFGIWYVLGQFSTLAEMGLIKLEEASGTWTQIEGITFDEAVVEPQTIPASSMETSNA